MIPNKNKKKTLEATVDEMRNFSYAYIEKYSPSKQQLKTYLLKKYLKLNSTGINKNNIKAVSYTHLTLPTILLV